MTKSHKHSNSKHSFSEIPRADIERSSFNRDFGLTTAFDSGFLIPVYCEEVLPGDTVNLRMSTYARLATPLHPAMANMYLDSHFFSVPMRLLWSNWEEFNGQQFDPGDSTDFTIPQMVAPVGVGHLVGSLSDYLGLPTDIPDYTHSCLFHRACSFIWSQWFRSEDIQDSVNHKPNSDGPDLATDHPLQRRGKRHDYFTSCLPAPQKGAAVTLPLGTVAPVIPTTAAIPSFDVGGDFLGLVGRNTGPNVEWAATPTNTDTVVTWNVSGLEADLTNATAATINAIREAFQLQRLLERDARGGTRYTEIVRSHFGVVSDDARQQRPEYLGGGTQNISITPVPQTSSSTGGAQIGDLAGYGVSTGSNHSFVKSFTEHQIIIGFVSVRADLIYQQGVEKKFSRLTRFDFFWPALAHLGEQAVLRKEIFVDGTANDDLVFGYQERHAEYRYAQSKVTGIMRSTATGSLDTWHLGIEFTAPPVLNAAFIEEDPPITRIIATQADPHFLFDAYFKVTHARPMPTYGVPGLIDHF